MKRAVAEGIRLFNSAKFFEAHEALEAVWLTAEGDEKVLLHGLIQIAAAFHHHTRRNPRGFHSLLEKGLNKLEKLSKVKAGIDLARLRRDLQPWRKTLGLSGTNLLPHIHTGRA